MTDPNTPSSSTAPYPNPDGQYTYTPKVLRQVSVVRQELSQWSSTRVGLEILTTDNALVDPTTIQVTVYQRTAETISNDPYGLPGLVIDGADLTHEETGVYSFLLDQEITQELSLVSVHWEYTIDTRNYQYWSHYEVLEPMPTYDSLTTGEKGVVALVTNMFGDLYDSVNGGPHLKEEFQTHFGTERIAQCMELAMSRINTTSQPYTHYNVGAGVGKRFPPESYSILIMGTYLEVVRHLIRSYTEIPTINGGPGVAYTDRSNYVDRWRAILNDEKEDYAKAIRSFKRDLLGLGRGSLIVAGGIFGQANYFRPGMWSAAARGLRFYPMSYVQTRPSGA